MRFSYFLLVVATILLASPDVVCAKQSTVASAKAATQLNSVNAGNTKRFLRSHKLIEDDDSADNAEKEERGLSLGDFMKLENWLKEGHSPGQVKVLLGVTESTQDATLLKMARKYSKMYKREYSTFNGSPYTG